MILFVPSFFHLADVANKRTAAAYFEATYFVFATWAPVFCKNVHALFVSCFRRLYRVHSDNSIVFNPDFKERFSFIP